MVIRINITDKRATPIGSPVIVCGNGDYQVVFDFDAEWSELSAKTARFVYVRGGVVQYQDVAFAGNTAEVPALADITEVRVGVFAGDLYTSTPALIPCELSIRCGTGAPDDPTPSQYDQIMALLASGALKGDPGEPGQPGSSVTVQNVSESDEDGGSNVVTFTDGNTLAIKNGRKGSPGEPGQPGHTPVRGTDFWTPDDIAAMRQYIDDSFMNGAW